MNSMRTHKVHAKNMLILPCYLLLGYASIAVSASDENVEYRQSIFDGCDSTSSLNNSYFVNKPKSTAADAEDEFIKCQLTVLKVQNQQIQFRLNFEELELDGPDESGFCKTDKLEVYIVNTSIRPELRICGRNDGQHVYVHLQPNDKGIIIRIKIDPSVDLERRWNIFIQQLPMGLLHSAPAGCLQYFLGKRGTIMSFNWQADGFNQHLANQNYPICVRKEVDKDFICLSQCRSSNDSFLLSGMSNSSQVSFMDCKNDYLVISCGSSVENVTSECASDRFCGGILSYEKDSSVSKPVCSKCRH